ncbi:hypothetical protein CDAR_388911 [Caerostris darwini]|uniref:Uncharacterized protein n=1 Tax=Caerostris darwini TaxID=1538125 RepID=A0AAV4S3X7_9ARAC|nr:hypothetical protein CDAR_388911 [Caerostris darwini]
MRFFPIGNIFPPAKENTLTERISAEVIQRAMNLCASQSFVAFPIKAGAITERSNRGEISPRKIHFGIFPPRNIFPSAKENALTERISVEVIQRAMNSCGSQSFIATFPIKAGAITERSNRGEISPRKSE